MVSLRYFFFSKPVHAMNSNTGRKMQLLEIITGESAPLSPVSFYTPKDGVSWQSAKKVRHV
jgi:hypothetical protein